MSATPITRGLIPRSLQLGINRTFGMEYNRYPEEHKFLFNMEKSRKAFEEDLQVGGMGLAPVKQESSGVQYDSFQQGFSPKYTHLAYAKGFIVSREAIKDELYGIFKKKARLLANSMRQTIETVAANVYNNAFDSNYTMPQGDGKSLLNTAHINGPDDSSTFSNMLSTPAALSETALEDLLIKISQATDTRGLQISLMEETLIVPPALRYEAARIIDSVLQNDTSNNAVNALKVTNAFPKGYKVCHYLDSDTAWFVKTDCMEGMKFFEREALEYQEDNDFDTSNYRFKSYMRFSTGWSDPRGLYGTQGV